MEPKKFHYVYLIEDTEPETEERFYIGVRSSTIEPENDPYLGSPSAKSSSYWRNRIKKFPEVFKKTILSVHPTRTDANKEEIRIHKELNVADSKEFYNRANASCQGFDPVGKFTYIDTRTNEHIWTSTTDHRVLDGTFKSVNSGTQIALNTKTLSFERVSVALLDNSEYVSSASLHMQNKTIFINPKTQQIKLLSVRDTQVLDGTYVGVNKGFSTFRNSVTGETKMLSNVDPLVLDGTYVGVTDGFCSYMNKNTGERVFTRTTDPLVLDGTYVGVSTKMTTFKHKVTQEIVRLRVDDPLVLDGTYVGINAGIQRNLNKIYKSNYIEVSSGKVVKTTKFDSRVLSKELVLPRYYSS